MECSLQGLWKLITLSGHSVFLIGKEKNIPMLEAIGKVLFSFPLYPFSCSWTPYNSGQTLKSVSIRNSTIVQGVLESTL